MVYAQCSSPVFKTSIEEFGAIAVLSPHPDDETLGCGSLLTSAFRTTQALVFCITNGDQSHPNSRLYPSEKLARVRKQELIRAVRLLGGKAENIEWMGYGDTQAPREADEQNRAAKRIAARCSEYQIRTLFTSAKEDGHKDHKATNQIAYKVKALLPSLRVLEYPIWSRWEGKEFTSDSESKVFRLESPSFEPKKRMALSVYQSQFGNLILDDPSGFKPPKSFVDFFASQPELFVERMG